MKKVILLMSILMCCATTSFSQCEVSTFIEDNYTTYAKFLALREIQGNPADPDHDNPLIPPARLTPYLEKLSAIYENPNNEPIIDLMFGDYSVNVSPEYVVRTPYNLVTLGIDNTAPWLDDFLNTGVSGNTELDNLMSTYGFYIEDYAVLGYTIVWLVTDAGVFNILPLLDEFLAVDFIDISETNVSLLDRLNYDGIPYFINSEPVEVSDITIENNLYTFCLYAGDCPAGCIFAECWTFEVAPDCSTVVFLETSDTNTEKFAVYPNPASDFIHIHGVTSEIKSTLIYSVAGQLMQSAPLNSDKINISNLQSGIYFLEIITSEGNKQIQKFIKHY